MWFRVGLGVSGSGRAGGGHRAQRGADGRLSAAPRVAEGASGRVAVLPKLRRHGTARRSWVSRCLSKILLLGQAPGGKEPLFAAAVRVDGRVSSCSSGSRRWASTKRSFERACTWPRLAGVFPVKIRAAAIASHQTWRSPRVGLGSNASSKLLRPQLLIPIGRLAIQQFLPSVQLVEQIGKSFEIVHGPAPRRRHSLAASVRCLHLAAQRAGQITHSARVAIARAAPGLAEHVPARVASPRRQVPRRLSSASSSLTRASAFSLGV